MSVRLLVACVALLAAAGCGGRSRAEISDVGGRAGAGGSGGSAGSGGGAGAFECLADVRSDSMNCGRCYHSCEGGACVGGACQPVALLPFAEKPPTALAVDLEYVWFVPQLSRVALAGGVPETIASVNGDVWGLAVDGQYAFWANVSAGLKRLDRGTRAIDGFSVTGYRVAVDDLFVYTASRGVFRVWRHGDQVELLSDLWGEAIAVDEDFVYFTVVSSGGLFRYAKSGGAPEALTANSNASYIAAWNHKVFISEQAAPSGVFEVTGPGLRTLVASPEEPRGIAADSSGVYFTDWARGTIWMRSHEPGAVPVQLASGQRFPRDLAIDARSVYWTNDDLELPLMKVAKP